MNNPSEPQPAAAVTAGAPDAQPGCLLYVLIIFAGLWATGLVAVFQFGVWFTDQITVYENTPLPWFAWPPIEWVSALILAVPVLLLMLLVKWPRQRAVYRTWAVAIAFYALLGIARAFPSTDSQPAAVVQIILTLIALAFLAVITRGPAQPANATRGSGRSAVALVLLLAPIGALPWLLWGALGSWLDTLLAIAAALCLGAFAALLLDRVLFRPLASEPLLAGREIFGHGLAAGVTLAILAGGFGAGGSQLLLLLALPPLGFAAAALNRMARNGGYSATRALTLLVGLGAAAPLLFIDPDEISIILGNDDIILWAARAAVLALLLGWLSGIVLLLLRDRLALPPRSSLAIPIAAATWIVGLAVYLLAGHPGFYGEQIFVILRAQADLRPAAAIANPDERAKFVYNALTQQANSTQAGLRAFLDQVRVPYRPYYLENAIEVNNGPLLRAYLNTRPEVDRILDSPHLRPLPSLPPVSTGDQPKPSSPQWNLTQIGVDKVWSELGVTGKGIVVGQSDSGVDGAHPVLRDGYRGRGGKDDYNWLDPWDNTRTPTDFGGHGTHTLGSILGRDNVGVAPGAEWFGCVNLARNLGNPAVYLNCMQFMLAPYPQNGDPLKDGDPLRHAHVINDSWGCPPVEGCDANALAPAASALKAAGVFVVVSAGNEGPRCGSVDSPLALYPDVFSVGAVNRDGTLAGFSSRGPVSIDGSNRVKPEIVAPGVEVLSSFPGGTYAEESGTSMAGPHVVGVVALMWSAQPKLIGDIERTRQILTQTASGYHGSQPDCAGPELPNNAVGYGVVDAYAAVKAALAIQ